MASYTRRDFAGAAVATTLASGISNVDTSLSISATTGWPSGSNGDFFIVVDRGNAGEEKIRIASRTSSTLTVASSGRGADGTSASAHSSGVTVELCLTAYDLDEANFAVTKTVAKVAAAGDLLYGDAANSLAKLAKGTSGNFLKQGASIPSWAALASTDISDFNAAVDARIPAVATPDTIFTDVATVGNTTSAETDLFTHTLTAGQLLTNSDTVEWWVAGKWGAASGTVRLKFYFGGTAFADTTALSVSAGKDFEAVATVIRTSSSAVLCSARVTTLSNTVTPYLVSGATVSGLTLANTQIFKLTGTASAGTASTVQGLQSRMVYYPI